MTDFTEVWVYLSASPLLFLTLTLAAFQAGSWVYERSGHKPFLNPVMTAVVLLVAILTLTQTPYPAYFEGAQFVHFLLGPATVALAIPLYRQFERVRRSAIGAAYQHSLWLADRHWHRRGPGLALGCKP
jgi:putative effector of murein hydrolase